MYNSIRVINYNIKILQYIAKRLFINKLFKIKIIHHLSRVLSPRYYTVENHKNPFNNFRGGDSIKNYSDCPPLFKIA